MRLPYGQFSHDLHSFLSSCPILVVCWVFLRDNNLKKGRQKYNTNYCISFSLKLGVFLENHGNDSVSCAIWQHDPWSPRGKCGWGVLVHVQNVWLHFLILSSFHSFTSSFFNWETVVTGLLSLISLCKNRCSSASVSYTQLGSCSVCFYSFLIIVNCSDQL